jgi:uncharacterized protein
MKAILSIDGGGIRGIIPARFLAAVEKEAGRPCHELFDLIAGTSTGGILGLGLAHMGDAEMHAYSAADLVDLYRNEGAHIFNRSAAYVAESVDGLTKPKYPADGIEAVLLEYFGDARLSDSLTNVLVTSYDTLAPGPYFFKSWIPQAKDFLMRDVARATSAAPTYFPPLLADKQTFVDGGVFANNPAACAWADKQKLFGAHPKLPELDWDYDTMVVSLGTGNTEKRCDPVNWGLARWARPLIDILLDGVSDAVDYQMREACPRYHRFQTDLPGVSQEMDDASQTTIATLLEIADRLVATSNIPGLVAQLKDRG